MSDDERSCAPVRGACLHVLGRFQLTTRDGADITPHDPDGRRLLAALAVAGGPRGRVELAIALWPELPPTSALATLSVATATVPDLVVEDGSGLALTSDVTVDLVDALGRLRRWEDDPASSFSATAEEVSRLGHDLLPGWTETWVEHERERFHKLRLHTLETLCRRLTDAGRHEPAIRAGQLVVDVQPLREGARRALIEAHLAAGNVSEAVHQYDAFVGLCATLGFTPEAELRNFFPPSPAWPVLHVRRPIHPGQSVGRGVRFEVHGRRSKVGSGAAVRG